ncbi:hypothetical protein ACHQM5_016107 [Ranunculus cassubicifolius]
MAGRFGSLSRSLISTTTRRATSSSFRSPPSIRSPPLTAPRIQQRGFTFSNPRTFGELGCTQSLLAYHSVVANTAHVTLNARACCELSQGIKDDG